RRVEISERGGGSGRHLVRVMRRVGDGDLLGAGGRRKSGHWWWSLVVVAGGGREKKRARLGKLVANGKRGVWMAGSNESDGWLR
ncbi:hypothetical protein AMTR_s00026p00228780, partial [Amborella trichopoda]